MEVDDLDAELNNHEQLLNQMSDDPVVLAKASLTDMGRIMVGLVNGQSDPNDAEHVVLCGTGGYQLEEIGDFIMHKLEKAKRQAYPTYIGLAEAKELGLGQYKAKIGKLLSKELAPAVYQAIVVKKVSRAHKSQSHVQSQRNAIIRFVFCLFCFCFAAKDSSPGRFSTKTHGRVQHSRR